MSLRFIPNEAKLSPLKMFLKYSDDKEKQILRAKKKKLLSLEYFLYIRGTIKDIFGFQELFMKSVLEEFNIKEKEPVAILNEVFSNIGSKYLIDGKFKLELFNNDYNNRLMFLSDKYKEKEEIIIVKKVIENNEYENSLLFKNNKDLSNIAEYKINLANRMIEMEFLTMYLAKTNETELKNFMNKNESSKIVNDITNRELFINLRSEYQKTLSTELRLKVTKKQKAL